jgi:hypothetical protein
LVSKAREQNMKRSWNIAVAMMIGGVSLFVSDKFWTTAKPEHLVSQAEAIIGRPLTPFSVAGVARRTTRRAVAAGYYGYGYRRYGYPYGYRYSDEGYGYPYSYNGYASYGYGHPYSYNEYANYGSDYHYGYANNDYGPGYYGYSGYSTSDYMSTNGYGYDGYHYDNGFALGGAYVPTCNYVGGPKGSNWRCR